MEEYVKGINGVLGYIKITNEGFKSSLDKFFNEEIREQLKEKLNLKPGDVIFIIANKENCAKMMGQLRIKLGQELDLIDKNVYEFCIVNDFPFYEMGDDGNIEFSHNPFSMPQGGLDALNNKNPFDIVAYQYDFVCNGYEMASGGVRNHDREILKKAFELAGYSEDVVISKFPSLYEAFKYGAPPHAGMAPGVDRIVMLLLGEECIREVIAFPMTANAEDLLMRAPGEVTQKQLREVHIKLS